MFLRGIALALFVAIADQLTKLWILRFFRADEPSRRIHAVTDFFNLVLTWNRGISFGFFNGAWGLNALLFVVLAAAIIVGLLWWLARVEQSLVALAIGLIVGGAAGNAADRILRGAVVDFLDFHLGEWHPFAFNVADTAISVGVGLLILDGLIGRRRAVS
jgi:signal peptidase II